MISCSATDISSSSNRCSGFSPAFAGLPALTVSGLWLVGLTSSILAGGAAGAGTAVATTGFAGDMPGFSGFTPAAFTGTTLTAGLTAAEDFDAAAFTATAFAGADFAGAVLTAALPAACFITRAISASPFHVLDGAGQLPGFGFQSHHPFRVRATFGLGQLADYPTEHTFHVFQPDLLGQLQGNLVVHIRRRRRPRSSDQVLLLWGITGQVGLEPGGAGAFVAPQHTDENRTVVRVELVGRDLRAHDVEGGRPDRQELDEIGARGG